MRKELFSQYGTAITVADIMTNVKDVIGQCPFSTSWSAFAEASHAERDAGNTSTEVG